MAADQTVLSFDRVVKKYRATVAVDGLSFDVRRGEMFGLIGPDGAGKTTSIRLLCGLLRPDGGVIRVVGRDPVKEHRAITGSVGYLSQRFTLYGDLTIDENVAFFAEIHGVSAYKVRRDRLLEMTQLTKFRGRLADQLSGGMKQKLALACTLVHEPDVILLDEPTTGVDPVSRREFWKLLSQFLASGITILMSTPYLDEAERCTRVALVDRGRLLALDTPGQLRASLPGAVVEVVVGDPRAAHERIRGEGVQSQVFGDRLHVWFSTTDPSEVEAQSRSLADRLGAGSHHRSRTFTSRGSARPTPRERSHSHDTHRYRVARASRLHRRADRCPGFGPHDAGRSRRAGARDEPSAR
jgi:ABC-2 type transport system ATP-binding protein